MKSISETIERIGNITSSGIYALTTEGKVKGTPGKPFVSYIEECNMERKLGRSLEGESDARPLVWGKTLEEYAFGVLGLEYKLCSQETLAHPDISYWFGSPDGLKFDEGTTVIDIKCPITLKSFCQLVDPLYDGLSGMEAMNFIRAEHKDGEKYYWQLVSNSIITGAKFAELIVFVPYKSELNAIRELVKNYDGDQQPLQWIYYAEDNKLPHLIDGGYYENINILRFEVPEYDKDRLTERVKLAGEMLIPFKTL
jgi:hypothetical protein